MIPAKMMMFYVLLAIIFVKGSEQENIMYITQSGTNMRLSTNKETEFSMLSPTKKNTHVTETSANSNMKRLILKKVFTYSLTIGNYIIPVFLLPPRWFIMTSLNFLLQGSEFPIGSGTLMIANIVQLTVRDKSGEGVAALNPNLNSEDHVRYPLVIVGLCMWDLVRNLALSYMPEIKVPESVTLCIGIANCVMPILQTQELFWASWTMSLLQNLSFDWLREDEITMFSIQDNVHVFNAITVFMINLWAIFLNLSRSGKGTYIGFLLIGIQLRFASWAVKK